MHRRLCALLLLLASADARADLAEIGGRGTLRALMVLDLDGRAFARQRADSPGFDNEVLDTFARLRKLRLEIVPVDGWDKLIPSLLDGKGDVIAGSFTVTDARRQLIDFSDEVVPTRSVVVTRRPHRVVHTLEELRGEKITVFKGTSMVETLQGVGVPGASLSYDVPAAGLSAGLKSGQVSCVVHDVQSAIVDLQADPELQLGMFVGPPHSYAFGLRKGDRELAAALNEHLSNLRKAGVWSRLVVKYFGERALSILQQARGE